MNGLNNQKGFTLIELVVVIVLLGILAVTAAPKFIDLQSDARTATLNAVKASMQSASSLVYGKSLIAGNEKVDGTDGPIVVVNGQNLDVSFGYPRDDDETEWQNILLELNATEFTVALAGASGAQGVTDGIVVFPTGNTGADQTTDANCYTNYIEAASASAVPTIEVVDCI